MPTTAPLASSSLGAALGRCLDAMALSQAGFDDWAQSAERWKVGYARWMLSAIMAATILGMLYLAPPVVREAHLLWFGERAEGRVTNAQVEFRGTTKHGSPIYRLDLQYAFEVPPGNRHAGETTRTLTGVYPKFDAGEAVTIYYDARDPGRSVAEYHLRSEVYGVFYLFGLMVVGAVVLPGIWLRRIAHWSARNPRAAT